MNFKTDIYPYCKSFILGMCCFLVLLGYKTTQNFQSGINETNGYISISGSGFILVFIFSVITSIDLLISSIPTILLLSSTPKISVPPNVFAKPEIVFNQLLGFSISISFFNSYRVLKCRVLGVHLLKRF